MVDRPKVKLMVVEEPTEPKVFRLGAKNKSEFDAEKAQQLFQSFVQKAHKIQISSLDSLQYADENKSDVKPSPIEGKT